MEWQLNTTSSWLLKSIVNCRDDVRHMSYWQDVIQMGKYKKEKMYTCMRGEKENMNWRPILVRNLARPRANFIVWLVFLGILNTKDRLTNFGVETDNTCVFCGEQESLEHLFFV